MNILGKASNIFVGTGDAVNVLYFWQYSSNLEVTAHLDMGKERGGDLGSKQGAGGRGRMEEGRGNFWAHRGGGIQ